MLVVAGLYALSVRVQTSAAESCVMIQELNANRALTTRGSACSTRLSPASTFKIPHALVALETGVVTAQSVEKPDGTRYEQQPKWNREHTVISALRPSVLWVFRRIAPRIGAERMREWLAKFDYGNRTVSGPITEYWTNGSLEISVPEQVRFLVRFYREELPVRPGHMRAVRGGLEQDTGTVENSRGIHPLSGDWRNATLNAKTGATTIDRYAVSWLVGLIRTGNRDYAFASAVWNPTGGVDLLDGAKLAARTFVETGLLR
jgi:Beta-lactamase class D